MLPSESPSRVANASAIKQLDIVSIPGAAFEVGSTLEDVARCATEWEPRLVDPSYKTSFRDWILKEYPKHRVEVKPFFIGRFPVTNAEYQAFIDSSPRRFPESIVAGAPRNHPVWGVSYDDAIAYVQWLGARTNARCSLPSEVEWECAARGPSGFEYPFGDSFDAAKCNTVEAAIGTTTPVDAYPQGASEFGVWDLAGNVEEWTSSFYSPYPGGQFIKDDLFESLGPRYRVLRGGSFALGGDLARCARRHGPYPGPVFRYRGFRIVVR